MFGFRPDGRRISTIDPIVRMTPYLMPMRCDAQVFLQQKLDYEPMARYIAAQSAKGRRSPSCTSSVPRMCARCPSTRKSTASS